MNRNGRYRNHVIWAGVNSCPKARMDANAVPHTRMSAVIHSGMASRFSTSAARRRPYLAQSLRVTRDTTPLSRAQVAREMTDDETRKGFSIDSLPWYTVPAILLGLPAVIAVLAMIWPTVFFDQFVEKYYWGPIRDDTGYNAVNTISWAVLMGVCIVGLTQILQGLKLKMNNAVIYGAVAWTVAGAIFRVMEDTRMFAPPLQYIMITPPIYLLFGLFGVLSLLVGVYLQKVNDDAGTERAMQKLWFIQAAMVLLYTLLWVAKWDQITVYLNPVHVAIFAIVTHFVARWWVQRTGTFDGRDFVLILSIAPLLMGIDYVIQFLDMPWSPSGPGIPSSFITAPLLAIAMTGIVWASARAAQMPADDARKGLGQIAGFSLAFVALLAYATEASLDGATILGLVAVAAVATGLGVLASRLMRAKAQDESHGNITILAYLAPINLLLISSQLMDGFATSLGLDMAGYSEKHVLSAYLIEAFHDFAVNIGWEFGAQYPTFLAFVPVKLAVSLLVVYAIDIYSREDVAKYPTLIGFVKFCIIMVGIGPAVRDFVRLSLGV